MSTPPRAGGGAGGEMKPLNALYLDLPAGCWLLAPAWRLVPGPAREGTDIGRWSETQELGREPGTSWEKKEKSTKYKNTK